jgi:CzcA family heavy metal efflux pump
MVEKIIRWALERRTLVLFLAAAFSVWGAYTAVHMPIDVFPDLTAPTVTVVTEAHGMAPEEVESLITFPVETAMNGAPKVRRVRSATAVGISVVWVEFDWDADVYLARQIVNEKLQLITGSLPAEAERPILAPISSVMGEILFLAVTSDKHSPMEMRTFAESGLRRRLLAVPGVAQVTPIGGDEKQYQVLIDPEKMALHRVSLSEVTYALKSSNKNASAGFLVSGGQEYLIRGIGRIHRLSDIEETVITSRDGNPVQVKHVAGVAIGPALKRGEGSFNGKPAVVIGIQKQPGVNTIALTKQVDDTIDDIQRSLPEGMKIHRNIFRQADFINVSVRNVEHALRDGAIFVFIILFLFLADIRATLIILTAIPLSLLAAILCLKAFGATINTMTLGGLAIAIGALVDDAIIDVENVVRRLKENHALPEKERKNILQVVLSATIEIRPSIVFATIIIMLAFLPLFFLTGIEGRLMKPLGFAYVVSLFASLLVSLFITPALCWFLLPKTKAVRMESESWLVVKLKKWYEPKLVASLRHPKAIAIAAASAALLALVVAGFLGRSFLPEFNEGTLTISAVTLPGTALPESDKLGRQVEEALLSFPEVQAVSRRTGRAELDEHAQGVEAGELDVTLKMGKRSKEEFLTALRQAFSVIPGMQIVIGQPISHRIDHMLSGTRANLAVKIFGGDLYELRKAAKAAEEKMKSVPGVVDLSTETQSDVPAMRIDFDRSQMARYGLKIEDLSESLEAAFAGHAVSKVLEGQNVFDLVVRYRNGEKTEPAQIEDVLIDIPEGRKIPLKMVAKVVRDQSPNVIMRENVQRKIVVMCNVQGRSLGHVVSDVKQALKDLTLPEGYYVEYGGQFQAEQEASKRLTLLGLAVILGIALILTVTFHSVKDALFIMMNLPLALIGGVAGVLLSGGSISIAALIGFVTLFGIATRNGIMLISHIRHLTEKEGVHDFREAVVRGSLERLSPILMTALASGLGLIPLALSGGKPGSEIQTPMAIVILCGLITSTALNMIVVPSLFYRIGKGK